METKVVDIVIAGTKGTRTGRGDGEAMTTAMTAETSTATAGETVGVMATVVAMIIVVVKGGMETGDTIRKFCKW